MPRHAECCTLYMTDLEPVHLVARALPHTLLFHDWCEALSLWRRLVATVPKARAVCVMPNHVHLVTTDPLARAKLSKLMSGFARWRSHKRGSQSATCWQPQPEIRPVADIKHLRRTIRYVLLNPCRGGLASDPLRWPLSNHRDLTGLAIDFAADGEPERLHRYVSSDPSVSLAGTELPAKHRGHAPLAVVEAAVGSVLRLAPTELTATAFSTRVLVRAATVCESAGVARLAQHTGWSRSWVYQQLNPPEMPDIRGDRALTCVMRVIGDPRFGSLTLAPRATPTRWGGWTQG